MTILPADLTAVLAAYDHFARRVASAALITLLEAQHEIVISFLSGKRPEADVPRRLGLRRLGDRWVARDPLLHTNAFNDERDDFDDDNAAAAESGPVPRSPKHDADSISELMRRHGFTRRRAQQIIKRQVIALGVQRDFFIGGEVPE